MKPKNNQTYMITGDVGPTLTRMTFPMIFGMLSIVVFNIADTFFIGRYGTDELAALAFTFPVILVVGSISMGLGIALSALVSRFIGEGHEAKVKRMTTDGLILSVLIVIVFILIGLFTIRPLFSMLGASEPILSHIEDYMLVWYPGLVFLVIPMVGNNAIRATGDMKTPSYVMIVASVINVILDPLLIFGWGPIPSLGIQGAAIATLAARALTLIVGLHVLINREHLITFQKPIMADVWQNWRDLMHIALPAAGARLIVPVGAGVITRLISVYGSQAVAAYGIGSRVDFILLSVNMALGSALSPFIGQNIGAGEKQRVKQGIRLSYRFSLIYGIFIYLLMLAFAPYISQIFNKDAKVIAITNLYLTIVPFSYGVHGIFMLSNTILNVFRKPLYAGMLTVFHIFILTIPMAYLGSFFVGLEGLFSGVTIAFMISGYASWLLVKKKTKHEVMTEKA